MKNAKLVRRVWANNVKHVHCVWIDRTKAYADISLHSWVAVRFIAVQEVLGAHTMVNIYDEVGSYVEGCTL